MTTPRLIPLALVLLALGAGAGAAGCGGSDDERPELPPEVNEVLTQAQDVRRDEVFIAGFRSPRIYGPYTFRLGGYVLRYEQRGEKTSERGLVVEVMRTRTGRAMEVVLKTTKESGRARLSASGRLFVRVESGRMYLLRFTPRR